MNLKKWKIICVFIIFALSALAHFGYTIFPSFITSLIFPVNESIGEHNKIIYFSFLVLALIERLKFKKTRNVFFSEFISSLVCSLLIMLIFTPIYLYILDKQDNMIITFIIYFICISISQVVSFKLLEARYSKRKERISIYLWVFILALNAYLTYYPPAWALYYDFTHKTYGVA